jgi:protein involved in polysaccharide export with SLBB domain
MTGPSRILALPLLLVLSLGAAGGVGAQSPPLDPHQVEISRTELQSLLASYEGSAASGAYSSSLREQARQEAALIRARLADGDFQTGDQIALLVEGEPTLTGDFTVQPGPVLILPEIGRIALDGVLRSELETHLGREIARFIRNPVVQARSSVRLMVTGGVGRSGYHVVATNTVLSEVLMLAGGPTQDARLQAIRVERGNRVIWQGEALQQAIIQGRTVDQLSIRAGDHIVVPVREPGRAMQVLQTTSMIVGPVVLLAGLLLRAF